MNGDRHVSDEDLVMAMDGELEEPRLSDVRLHLAHCWQCRSRLNVFEGAVAEYMEGRGGGPAPVSSAGPTARLRAALRDEVGEGRADSRRRRLAWGLRSAVAFGAVLSILLPLTWLFVWRSGVAQSAGPLPNARLTPGAVRFVLARQVCLLPLEDEGKLVPPELASVVFRTYRISDPQPRAYEVDYLISPSLGGATAVQNLWPLPYSEGVWTSRVKDALEDHLRTLMCAGKVDLETAQREIATNWIAAYQKYFNSRLPTQEHARFVKDSPWE